MTTCTIHAVCLTHGHFHWHWRDADHNRKSGRSFPYFYDCLQDARRHGLQVDLRQVVEQLKREAQSGAVQTSTSES